MSIRSPHIDPMEQQVLLASIAGGDEAAFSRMLRIYGDTVFSQALAYTKSVQTAEEVSQDVFLHVWNKRDKLLEVEHFEAWFFQVTRRQILNYMKKKVSQPLSALLPDLRGVMEMEEQLVPDRQMEARDTYQLLLKGIEQLPEKRGLVFRMSRIEGISNLEIAERLQMHPDTVAQYIMKAKVFLQTWLEKHGTDTIVLIVVLRGLP